MNKGGRPRLLSLSEIRQQASLEAQNKNNGGKLPNGLKQLKEMLKLRNITVGEGYIA